MSGPYSVSCPVEVNGEPCELDITVWLEPGCKGSQHEPPYDSSIDEIEAPCGHSDIILASEEYMKSIWKQIEHEDERRYDDMQEARVDAERDRWYGDD